MASRNKSRNRGKRPTATLDLKAKDVSEKDATQKVDASKVLSRGTDTDAPKAQTGQQKSASDTSASTPDSKTAAKSQGAASSSAPDGKTGKATSTTPESAKPTASKSDTAPKKSSAASDKTGAGGLGGTITHLLAGGLGGLLAFFGAGMFGAEQGNNTAGTAATPAANEALATRLTALENRKPDAAKAEIPAELTDRIAKLESLNSTIATLQEQQAKLTTEATSLASGMKALADPAGGGATELRQRLDSMESTISSLGKAAEGAGGKAIPELAALAGRLNDMRTEMEAKIVATQKALQDDVAKQVAVVSTAVKATAETNDGAAEAMETLKGGNKRLSLGLETARTETARIAKSVASLRTASDKTNTALAALETSATALTERMSGLEEKTTQSLSALPGKAEIVAAVAPITSKISALETSVSGVLKRETDRAASAKNVLLSIELANLQRALDQGRPITDEIKNLQANAPEGMDLTSLNEVVSKTVVGHDELTRQFSNAASQTLQSEQLDENAGTFDKLLANARAIVRVRKTGDVEGTSTEAVIARAEDSLKQGDLGAAVKELMALDEKAAASMKDWMAKARDRLAVDAALAKVEASLKAAVSSSATN